MIIEIHDDFDLERIADSGQTFRFEKAEKEAYRIIAGDRCLYIREQGGEEYELSCEEGEFYAFWRDYFDLETNYREIRARIDERTDPFLYRASESEKGIRILRQDPWEMLITFIISQNRNIPSIRRSVELLSRLSGREKTDAGGEKYFAFPNPEALSLLSEKELLSCKLGYRWRYVSAAAKAVCLGEIDLAGLGASDEERAMKELTGLLGVGKKVASCVALFGLHHINAFPVDVWVKRILASEYKDGYPYDKYSPYNGIYQQFMFAYYRHKE